MTDKPSIDHQIRDVLARLDLMSHVSAVSLDTSGRDMSDDIGGKRPPGGIDRRDEQRDTAEAVYKLKSADHYRQRQERAHSDRALQELLDDAKRSLEAWQRTPPNPNPEWGSFEWKRQIAFEIESGKRTVDNAKSFYSVSKATIYRYVAAYGRKAA